MSKYIPTSPQDPVGGEGRTGLMNPQNQCYLLASMQCMSHTDPYRVFIMRTNGVATIQSDDPLIRRFTYAFHLFINAMWSGNFASMRIQPLKHVIAECNAFTWQINNWDQQDAMVFLETLLDGLHQGYNTRIAHSTVILSANDPAANVATWRSQNDSIISEQFWFYTVAQYTCKKCKTTKYGKIDKRINITAEFPENAPSDVVFNLGAMLRGAFQSAVNNEVRCKVCKLTNLNWPGHGSGVPKPKWYKELQPRSKKLQYKNTQQDEKLSIWVAPEILIIQLKRFKMDMYGGTMKVQHRVKFPFVLNLTEMIANQDPNVKVFYDLYAIVCHSGSLNAGHYWAFAKPINDPTGVGWCKFNDDHVTPKNKAELQDEKDQRDAYILFYARRKRGGGGGGGTSRAGR